MTETRIILAIIAFWLLLALTITVYNKSDFPPIVFDDNFNKTTVEFEQQTDQQISTGLLDIFQFLSVFASLINPFDLAEFDNVAVNLFINTVLSILRFTTLYIILRLLRGGG